MFDRPGLNLEVEHVLLSDNRHGLAMLPGGLELLVDAHVHVSHSAVVAASDNGGEYSFCADISTEHVMCCFVLYQGGAIQPRT
jgi:hypothetical protein